MSLVPRGTTRGRAQGWSHSIALLVALSCLAGCAVLYEGKYDWDQGWRVGRIIRLGPGASGIEMLRDDCRNDTLPADVARTVYAEVAYHNEGRWLRHRVVPVPENVPIHESDKVYVNLGSCINGLVKASGGS
jgi:hypothetical protein